MASWVTTSTSSAPGGSGHGTATVTHTTTTELFSYVAEHASVYQLPIVMNRWSGSEYHLVFCFNPVSSNDTEYGKVYCLWELRTLRTSTTTEVILP